MDNGMGAQAGSGGADGGSVRTDSSAFDRLPPQDLEPRWPRSAACS